LSNFLLLCINTIAPSQFLCAVSLLVLEYRMSVGSRAVREVFQGLYGGAIRRGGGGGGASMDICVLRARAKAAGLLGCPAVLRQPTWTTRQHARSHASAKARSKAK
jgi:hypothetical protein